jgi:hypothetical protein
MPHSRLTRIPKSVFIFMLVGALLMGVAITYGIRAREEAKGHPFSAEQLEWIDGVAVGAAYKDQYSTWKATPGHSENDARAFPEIRCAGKFYPSQPVAMKGCVTAVKGRPDNGYQYP